MHDVVDASLHDQHVSPTFNRLIEPSEDLVRTLSTYSEVAELDAGIRLFRPIEVLARGIVALGSAKRRIWIPAWIPGGDRVSEPYDNDAFHPLFYLLLPRCEEPLMDTPSGNLVIEPSTGKDDRANVSGRVDVTEGAALVDLVRSHIDGPALANHRHFDLAWVLETALDLACDLVREEDCGVVVDLTW